MQGPTMHCDSHAPDRCGNDEPFLHIKLGTKESLSSCLSPGDQTAVYSPSAFKVPGVHDIAPILVVNVRHDFPSDPNLELSSMLYKAKVHFFSSPTSHARFSSE